VKVFPEFIMVSNMIGSSEILSVFIEIIFLYYIYAFNVRAESINIGFVYIRDHIILIYLLIL